LVSLVPEASYPSKEPSYGRDCQPLSIFVSGWTPPPQIVLGRKFLWFYPGISYPLIFRRPFVCLPYFPRSRGAEPLPPPPPPHFAGSVRLSTSFLLHPSPFLASPRLCLDFSRDFVLRPSSLPWWGGFGTVIDAPALPALFSRQSPIPFCLLLRRCQELGLVLDSFPTYPLAFSLRHCLITSPVLLKGSPAGLRSALKLASGVLDCDVCCKGRLRRSTLPLSSVVSRNLPS